MDRATTVKAIAALRAVVGVSTFATPRVSASLFGIEPKRNPQAPYVARLFGARDAGLAYGVLKSEDEAQDLWLAVGLACDAADAVAGLAGGRAGYLKPVSSALVSGTAMAAVALGVVALRSKPASAPSSL